MKSLEKIAELSKLSIKESERERINKELALLLDVVAPFKELDLEGVPPTVQPHPLEASLREDRVEESLAKEEWMKGAPAARGGFFFVPRVMGEETE